MKFLLYDILKGEEMAAIWIARTSWRGDGGYLDSENFMERPKS